MAFLTQWPIQHIMALCKIVSKEEVFREVAVWFLCVLPPKYVGSSAVESHHLVMITSQEQCSSPCFLGGFLDRLVIGYWFMFIKPSLHLWNKDNLVMVGNLFDVLFNLQLFCWEFFFVCNFTMGVSNFLFIVIVSLFAFGIRVITA